MVGKARRVVFIGNLGLEEIQIGSKRKEMFGGSALRFALFSRFLFPGKMIAVAGPKKKWSPVLSALSKLNIDVTGVAYSQKELDFLIKYDQQFRTQTFKIKNAPVMFKVGRLGKNISFNKNDHFHIGPLPVECQLDLVKLAEKNKVDVSLQTHFTAIDKKKLALYSQIFKKIKVLFLNSQEASSLTGEKENLPAGRQLAKMCSGLIFITAEDEEVIVFNQGELVKKTRPLPAGKIKEVTGAGDAFSAGIIGGLMNFKRLDQIILSGLTRAHLSLNFNSTSEVLKLLSGFND